MNWQNYFGRIVLLNRLPNFKMMKCIHIFLVIYFTSVQAGKPCHQIDDQIQAYAAMQGHDISMSPVRSCEDVIDLATQRFPTMSAPLICIADLTLLESAAKLADQNNVQLQALLEQLETLRQDDPEFGKNLSFADLCSVTCGRCTMDEVTPLTREDLHPSSKREKSKVKDSDDTADKSTIYIVILITAGAVAFFTLLGCIYYAVIKKTTLQATIQNQGDRDGIYANLGETTPA